MDLALYSYSAEIWPFPRLEECLFTIAENRLNLIGSSNISLKQIYETYWEEWNRLKSYPATEQKAMKIAFLRSCLEVTPKNIFVWDEATQLKLPYHLKHDRDLTRLEQKIQELSPTRAVQELDSFMWNMRLKGDGYGVL